MSELIIYSSSDNQIQIEVILENDIVWLSQSQISELFNRDRSVVTKHINNISKRVNLIKKAMCKKCTLQIQTGLSSLEKQEGY